MTPFPAVATHLCELRTLRVLIALSFALVFLHPLLLVLALDPATFHQDQPELGSTPFRGTCSHLGQVWHESDEICGSSHDSGIRLEDKLEFSRVSVVLSRSPIHQRVSRYRHHTARSTTILPSSNTDQNNKPSSATMCNEMNCDDMTRAMFS